jgi:hypothetical protein
MGFISSQPWKLRHNIGRQGRTIKAIANLSLKIVNCIEVVCYQEMLSLHLIAKLELFEVNNHAIVGSPLLPLPESALTATFEELRPENNRNDSNLLDRVAVVAVTAPRIESSFDVCSHGAICLYNSVVEFTAEPKLHTSVAHPLM